MAERATRPGEALDVAAADAWLRERVPDLRGTPEVAQYSGGASNWTYRVKYPSHDLVLRRPPAGTKARGAHDVAREYRVQLALKPAFPAVPAMVALCEDPAVIGAEFYVMERIEGLIPRARMPEGLRLDAAGNRRLALASIDTLVDLHRVDAAAAGLAGLGRGPGYPRRQVDGWSERWDRARTWNVGSFRRVRDWLRERVPDDVATCVIHNDWRLDNIGFSSDGLARVVGVLDWEMATLGDPLMDLGSALAYWVEAEDDPVMRSTRRQPTHLPGMLRRHEVVERYFERTGLASRDFTFYEVFGLFRLAVIAQQIYYRYHRRESRNPAFRHFWVLVNYLDWRCRRVIARGSR